MAEKSFNLGQPFVVHVEDKKSWPLLEALGSLDLFTKLCEIPLNFRVINRHVIEGEDKEPLLDLTPAEFGDWLNGSTSEPLLSEVSPNDFALYAGYQYMHETFESCPDLLKLIDWSPVGLTGRGPVHTTLWLGSAGAYTAGHYDTYGCNFVAQVFGEKRWVFFPPNQGDCLYATRIPYEESSVFCRCSLAKPNKFPKLQNTTPYTIDLKPGDILYVPPKWWHFVSCLNTSLAINTWIDLPCLDNFVRVQEALVRWIVASHLSSSEEEIIRINYTEKDPLTMNDSETLLCAAIERVKNEPKDGDANFYASKVIETATVNKWPIKQLEEIKFCELVKKIGEQDDSSDDDEDCEDDTIRPNTLRDHILDAMLAPDVIELAAKKLLLNIDDDY